MRQSSEYIKPFIPYAVIDSLEMDRSKYAGRKKNAYESRRRRSKLPTLQSFSNAACDELNIKEFKLKIIGSVEVGCAHKDSDLDICVRPGKNHPILEDKDLRIMYSRKMQFLINASKNIDFPVSILFVRQ